MFAHRSAWCGAVLLGVLVMCTGRAEPPSPGAGPSPAGKESPEIQALIKEQREAVEKIWEGVKALREIGQDVPQNFRVNINYDALLELDLSAAATLEERVKARQRYLDQMRRFEQYWEEQLKRQKDAGQRGEPSNEDGVLDIYLDAKVVRLNTEIELLRVKTPAGEKEPSQIETRLKELRVVQEQVLKQTRKQFEEAQAAAKAGKARGGSPRELASLGANLLRAELIVASRPEERVKAYEKYVPLAKAVEQTVKERYDLGRDGMDAVLRAKDARLAVEIELLRAKSGVTGRESPRLQALLKEQRDVRHELIEALMELWKKTTRVDIDELVSASASLQEVELALASKPADALAARKKHLDLLKEREEIAKERLKVGRVSAMDYYVAKAERLHAEVELLRAKSKISPPDK